MGLKNTAGVFVQAAENILALLDPSGRTTERQLQRAQGRRGPESDALALRRDMELVSGSLARHLDKQVRMSAELRRESATRRQTVRVQHVMHRMAARSSGDVVVVRVALKPSGQMHSTGTEEGRRRQGATLVFAAPHAR